MDVYFVDSGKQRIRELFPKEITFDSIRWTGDAEASDGILVFIAYRCTDRVQPRDRLTEIERVTTVADSIEFIEQLILIDNRVLGFLAVLGVR